MYTVPAHVIIPFAGVSLAAAPEFPGVSCEVLMVSLIVLVAMFIISDPIPLITVSPIYNKMPNARIVVNNHPRLARRFQLLLASCTAKLYVVDPLELYAKLVYTASSYFQEIDATFTSAKLISSRIVSPPPAREIKLPLRNA